MAWVCWLVFLAALLPQSLRDEVASAGRLASPPTELHGRESKNVTADYSTSHERTFSRAVSALGDPGMRSDKVRVAVEGWNFCNRAGNLGNTISFGSTLEPRAKNISASPRWADCTDLVCEDKLSANACRIVRKVAEADSLLSPGDPFPTGDFKNSTDPDIYAIEKEKYLGARCADDSGSHKWSFWMIMLKNGNFDQNSGLCPLASNSNQSSPSYIQGRCGPSFNPCLDNSGFLAGFPCFGYGCMNQPLVVHNWSDSDGVGREANLAGGIYGTYDLDEANLDPAANENTSTSFFSVSWHKNEVGGSWQFKHVLRVSRKYPWLMLYLRADTTHGTSGGYPWDTRGMMHTVPRSPKFTVVLTLNITRGGGPGSQFYLLDIGGCWKNNGKKCDGNLTEDVTRYSEMIINPEIAAWCGPETLQNCPPFHTTVHGKRIPRSDRQNFPYSAYHYYCVPYNALYAEAPYSVCDPFSNPQPQELQQLLPHPEWAVHGYPSKQGDGWIGDARTWVLDTGGLSSRLHFYQDPETKPAKRKWPSIDVGPEIFTSGEAETAEWTVSDFNVLIPSD